MRDEIGPAIYAFLTSRVMISTEAKKSNTRADEGGAIGLKQL
jgi:hypothetical protein